MGLSALTWALLALLTPLGAALVIALVVPLRRRGTPATWLSIAAVVVSFISAIQLFASQLADPHQLTLYQLDWLPSATGTMARIGVRLDGISIPMLLVLATVAMCVQVFSLGYMADEPAPARGRYYGYHSLFVFAMGVLVLAPNMLELFLGWELVGLTSYLLIGFYYQKQSAAQRGDQGLLGDQVRRHGTRARHHPAVCDDRAVRLERRASCWPGRHPSRS